MKTIFLIIPGQPIAKARPRFYRRGKFVGTYNSQDTEEGRFMLECQSQMNGRKPFTGPVSLEITFEMCRPKSHYGTGRNAGKIKQSAPMHHMSRPDLDNLVKFVKDCLNGIGWRDDSQVTYLRTQKRYSETPGTLIFIQERQ